jgi:putative transcriptional regulator
MCSEGPLWESSGAMHTLRGALLVAAPTLLDPNFQRTVVLVTEHTDEGAMGLVLNRPTDTTVADAAPELEALTGPEELVHQGGPVQPRAVVVLAEFADPEMAAHVVMGDIGFVRADADLERAGVETRRGRVYAGYAGWGPGQLEGELEDEGWIVVERPLADELFSPGPDDLWHDVLERQGGQLALVARMPLDPSLN